MKLVFFGSDDFAAVHLERLLTSSHKVIGCVTQPNKPQGRGLQVVNSPIYDIALARNIPCFQPDTLKDPGAINHLQALAADIFVVVAYGKILTPAILSMPKLFCVNVHGS